MVLFLVICKSFRIDSSKQTRYVELYLVLFGFISLSSLISLCSIYFIIFSFISLCSAFSFRLALSRYIFMFSLTSLCFYILLWFFFVMFDYFVMFILFRYVTVITLCFFFSLCLDSNWSFYSRNMLAWRSPSVIHIFLTLKMQFIHQDQ